MSERRFDQWQDLYAQRTSSMKSSEIRNLFIVTSRPDIISFGGGMPDTRLLPLDEVAKAIKKVMGREGSAALQYGSSEGHEGLKHCIIKLMAEEGIKIDTDDLLVTDGGQQALDFVGKIFINPNDKIIVEGPSYVGAIQAFSSYQASFIHIPLDANGLQVDILAKTLEKLEREKVKPKFLYTVSTFHNPAGVTLSWERRKKLLELAHKHNLLIIEDGAYNRLRFEGRPLKPLRAMDEKIIYIGTFSKIFAPGVRVGWIIAPRSILEKINFAKQAANLCPGSFTQRVVEEFFRQNLHKAHISNVNKVYRQRRDIMVKAIKKYFPKEAKFNIPQGGLFVWVELPRYIDTTDLLAEAISEEKVAYIGGGAFFADGSGKNCMRLNFSYPQTDQIEEGIKKLGKVIKKQMALYRSLARSNIEMGRPK